jgi:hypothetical protein
LRQQAHVLCQTRTVFVYGFGIGGQTDIAVLRRVFPAQNVELIVGSAAEVAHVLLLVRERLRRAQLRQAVEEELRAGKVEAQLAPATVSGNVTRFDSPLTIQNVYRHLPIRLEQVRMEHKEKTSQEIQCALEGVPANDRLEAGKEWRGRVHGALLGSRPFWHPGKVQRRYQATFQVVPLARFPHEAALKELGFDTAQPSVQTATLTADLHVQYGLGMLAWAAGGVFGGVGIVAFVAGPINRVETKAVLRLTDWPTGVDVKREWTLEGRNEPYLIGSDRGADISLPRMEPQHARVRLGADGSFSVTRVNGEVVVEEQRGHRTLFRIGNDYRFRAEVSRTHYRRWLPLVLWGIALVALAAAFISYRFAPW